MDDIKTINRILQDCNLSLWGVCPFWAVKDSFISCRAKNKIPADAVSVICVLFPYLTVEEKKRNISRYAVVPDYHLVASRIADDTGITRSVIVNALKKFDSAGVISTKSSGMKGTKIKVLNEVVYDELKKLED